MLRKMTLEDVPKIVEIHRTSWHPSEISVKLGPKFLELFYISISQAPDAFTYIFEQNGEIIAYSTGFSRYRDFNTRLIKSKWIPVSWIVMSRFLSGKLAIEDVCNMFLDSRKLRNLRYPDAHWGANALSNEYKGTPLGKEAYASTAQAVFRDLQKTGCGGCSVSCGTENKAMEKWIIHLGFEKVDTVPLRGKSVLVYERTFHTGDEGAKDPF